MTIVPPDPMPELASLSDVSGLAPSVTEAQVKAAGAVIRHAAGWHIAPVITQTILLDHDGANRVILPSLLVHNVTSVRSLVNVTSPVDLTGWRWSRQGILSGRFPAGLGVLEVTFEHGFETAPGDLLQLIGSVASGRPLKSRSAGPFSETYDTAGAAGAVVDSVLDLYSLGPRP